MRIVVVEDEIRIREGLEKLLQKEKNYQVVGLAENGREGWELIRREKPELVIADIRMPEMDGIEMLSKLREEGIAIKAIILALSQSLPMPSKPLSWG